jgi:hypothetical protein
METHPHDGNLTPSCQAFGKTFKSREEDARLVLVIPELNALAFFTDIAVMV